MRVSIHQPNFMPWMGYFKKIMASDVFVFLDDVQIQKKAGSWTNRVKVLNAGEPKWLTVPIVRVSGTTQNINMTEFAQSDWGSRCQQVIDAAYRKAPFHKEIMDLVETLFQFSPRYLSEFNENSVKKIFDYLQLSTPKLVKSSEFEVSATATERLIELVLLLDGDEYLCGDGSAGYLDSEKFASANIKLTFQNHRESPYIQLNSSEFIPGLSIVDALMMVGPKAVQELLKEPER